MNLVTKIFDHVRKNGTYVPRDYQTIGGMWATDTWVLGDVKVQMMDEGYTQAVIAPGLRVVALLAGEEKVHYQEGDPTILASFAQQLNLVL